MAAARLESSDVGIPDRDTQAAYWRQGAQRQSVPVALWVVMVPEYRVPGRRNRDADAGRPIQGFREAPTFALPAI